MSCDSHILEYPAGNVTCRGEYFIPKSTTGSLPVVLVVHAWDGLNDEVRQKAHKLAHEGFIAFAVDIHGEGATYEDPSELESVLTPYMRDRGMLVERIRGAAAAAKTIPGADPRRLGAMGYCFGGMTVLDLARAGGEGARGIVSFHGLLDRNTVAGPDTITSSILVLHGEDDPLVSPDTVAKFKQEMTDKQADWQLVAYGHTVHAFTRPAANNPAFGAVYNEAADRRSWRAMLDFFREVL